MTRREVEASIRLARLAAFREGYAKGLKHGREQGAWEEKRCRLPTNRAGQSTGKYLPEEEGGL